MTCASCVVSVESALRSVPGVASADVNLATERATVRLDPAADMTKIVHAVERAGYGALPIPSDDRERAEHAEAERALRMRYVAELRRALTVAAIRALLALGAKTARLRRAGGIEEDIPIADLVAGDVIVVRPGETIASDGLVIAGSSAVDESMVTGESVPVDKSAGDDVTGGTLNRTGALRVRATKVGGDTLLASIVRLVEEAQGSKPPIQRLVDRIASVFVPIVLGIELYTLFSWFALGPAPSFGPALRAAIAVLIIACPCALRLATPHALTVGIARGAGRGT